MNVERYIEPDSYMCTVFVMCWYVFYAPTVFYVSVDSTYARPSQCSLQQIWDLAVEKIDAQDLTEAVKWAS